MRQYPIAKEGWPIALLFLVLSLLALKYARNWTWLPAILFVFTLFFFRNPSRSVPEGEGIIVAPADGTVMKVDEIYEGRFIKGKSLRISIFLSIFDVHINRIPIGGKVSYVELVPGRYLPAFRPKASEFNHRNYLGLETLWGPVLVVQIAGIVARRIVCWVREGDGLVTGQRFGLIKFGSCTEVYLPKEAIIEVKPGDKVKGGETIIGRFYS